VVVMVDLMLSGCGVTVILDWYHLCKSDSEAEKLLRCADIISDDDCED